MSNLYALSKNYIFIPISLEALPEEPFLKSTKFRYFVKNPHQKINTVKIENTSFPKLFKIHNKHIKVM